MFRLHTINGRHDGYEVVDHAKTDAGNRYVPLTKKAIEILELVKALNVKEGWSTDDNALIL